MKKIFNFFKQRWVITLLGIIALSLIIWYVGPLIAIAGSEPLASEFIRLMVIITIVVIWCVRLAYNKIKAVMAERQLMAAMTESSAESDPDYGAEEVALLKTRFEEAVELLKQSGRAKGQRRASLYDLPWYVIIGPPGAGKTTALVNSGLEFPLADRFGDGALQGVGGTRNCDWWFSDSAVLLDTAGRYVTQDSRVEVDSAAWKGFLDLLKKHRRRRPINGVLVAISISDLMVQNEHERKLHVNAIKQRVNELNQHFGIRFPVYVLLTKCDLIAGFKEFFDNLGREERAQVWGMTFPLEEQPSGLAVDSVNREFDGLLQRINERLIARLSQERDNQRRTLIYGFPQQLGAIKESLDQFLQAIFRPSRFDEPAMLRGVYFTSGTQEGTPIDRVMGNLARSFGLNQQAIPSFGGKNRAYFITDLLKKVIIPEAQIAGTNRRLERQRIWLQNGAYASAVGITFFCLIAWVVSYHQNKSYIDEVARQVDEVHADIEALTAAHRDPLLVLQPLNTLRAITTGLEANEEGAPWLMGFGLYQGERLGAKARAAYQRLLNNVFLPRLLLRLEAQLKQGGANTDYLFEGLKVYLMLREQAHFDAEAIETWISLDWDQNQPRDLTEQRVQQLNDHLNTLLAAGPPVLPMVLDEQLIADTRTLLKRVPLAQRAYGRLKRANLNSDIAPFRITEVGGSDAPMVFSRRSGQPLNVGIDGFFTYTGFWQRFLPQSQLLSQQMAAERWVIGEEAHLTDDSAAQAQLDEAVQQLYQAEYIDRWQALLTDLQLVPVVNIVRGVDVLNLLSGSNSPLRRLLNGISHETSLTRLPAFDVGLMDKMASSADSLKRRLTSIIGTDELQTLLDEAVQQPGDLVEAHFAALNRLVAAREDGTMPLDEILLDFNELSVNLDAIANATDRGQAAMEAVRGSDVLNNIVQKIQIRARRQPPLVGDMMMAMAVTSKNLTIGGVHQYLNAMWQSKPLPFCHQAINKRYPVMRASAHEITLEDFGRFFGPAGVMDNFFNDYLAGFVDTTTVPWRWRGAAGIAPQVLEQFRRASVIREAFFQGVSQQPGVNFELKPINMDSSITRFLLNLDGQKVIYSHGPIRLTALQWPGPGREKQVQLQLLPTLSGVTSSVRELGPWAWFRVLDSANIQATSRPERYRVTFDIGNRKARYELHASSTYNPFRIKELSQFRCPEKL